MRTTRAGGAVALLASITIALAPAAQGTGQLTTASGPDRDADLLMVEHALLDATYACLVDTHAVSSDTPASVVVGDVAASGDFIAPADISPVESSCMDQVAARVVRILEANSEDATVAAQEVAAFADEASAGAVAFTTQRGPVSRAVPRARSSRAGDPGVAAAAAPNANVWINGMNQKQDTLMDFFITGYGDPGYYDWSSDECSAPLAGNGPYGFNWPCRRHDFGYRNLKRGDDRYPAWSMWNKHNKAVTDYQFYNDMYDHCAGTSNPSNCRQVAAVYYREVCNHGPWDTTGLYYTTLTLTSR